VNVTIQERKFALRSEYDITVPGDSYYAVRKLFSLRANLQVLTEDRRLLARILGHFSLFRSKYDFIFADGKLYRLWSEQVWKVCTRVKALKRNSGCTPTKALTTRSSMVIVRSQRSVEIGS
jgi:hypothetical protein